MMSIPQWRAVGQWIENHAHEIHVITVAMAKIVDANRDLEIVLPLQPKDVPGAVRPGDGPSLVVDLRRQPTITINSPTEVGAAERIGRAVREAAEAVVHESKSSRTTTEEFEVEPCRKPRRASRTKSKPSPKKNAVLVSGLEVEVIDRLRWAQWPMTNSALVCVMGLKTGDLDRTLETLKRRRLIAWRLRPQGHWELTALGMKLSSRLPAHR